MDATQSRQFNNVFSFYTKADWRLEVIKQSRQRYRKGRQQLHVACRHAKKLAGVSESIMDEVLARFPVIFE